MCCQASVPFMAASLGFLGIKCSKVVSHFIFWSHMVCPRLTQSEGSRLALLPRGIEGLKTLGSWLCIQGPPTHWAISAPQHYWSLYYLQIIEHFNALFYPQNNILLVPALLATHSFQAFTKFTSSLGWRSLIPRDTGMSKEAPIHLGHTGKDFCAKGISKPFDGCGNFFCGQQRSRISCNHLELYRMQCELSNMPCFQS